MTAVFDVAPSGRLLRPLSEKYVETLHKFTLTELESFEALLAASPHNRQLSTLGDALNLAVAQLPRIENASCRAAVLRIIRHMGSHRFTVHNTRYVLAAVARLETAHAAAGAAGAAAGSSALELLQLMGDVLAAATGPELPAFWDMGVGVMGATGFDLPADRLVVLASKGAFSISCWLRLESLGTQPVAVFGVADVLGSGVQLQLQRAGGSLARAELLVTETAAATKSTGSKLLSRFGGGAAAIARATVSGGLVTEMASTTFSFEGEMVVRCGAWHLLTLSCRRGALLGFGSAGRDEAMLCIDGSRAARAAGFRFPQLTTEQAAQGRAAVGAPAALRTPAAALRGQLGPFVLFDAPLGVPELEACFDAARVGRTLFEWPHVGHMHANPPRGQPALASPCAHPHYIRSPHWLCFACGRYWPRGIHSSPTPRPARASPRRPTVRGQHGRGPRPSPRSRSCAPRIRQAACSTFCCLCSPSAAARTRAGTRC